MPQERTTAEELRRMRASMDTVKKVPYQETNGKAAKTINTIVRSKPVDDKTQETSKQLLAHFSC